MKYGFICLTVFLACELVGAWQGWIHLMVVGGGWLVLAMLVLFTSTSRTQKQKH